MDVQVPAVVAVVVTTDPGPWLEESLTSLARQDYEDLSVLVLATGNGPDPSARVGRILPNAFVRQLPGDVGYAAASNAAMEMVEGAAFFLLCHHDCALDDDVVHKMVEESFRSNAGVVSPKFVHWDDPSILLHVGMHCDKTGAVVDRIGDGEVDHGQHDAVRDIFVAPGGCILIRADLWRELGGFDAGIVAMGEDLDLSWRSQVAGSRVVVAPEARVRHREVVASGAVPLAVTANATGAGDRPVTLQALQRRHELRAVLKCYGWFHLIRVLPQAAILAFFEVVVALLARDRLRARAVAGAWRWNAHHWGEIRGLRAELKTHRLFPDSEVRRLQLRGSARLSRYFSRLSHQGLTAANAVVTSHQDAAGSPAQPEVAVLTGSVGLAFSEDADFDDLDDLGHRSGRDRFGRKVRRAPLSTGRSRTVAVTVAALVILLGTRELLFGSLPLVGQLAPLPGWAASWHHFFSGWQPAGAGTTAPSTPAFGLVSAVGTVLLGSMGLTQRILLLGCIPVGAIGFSRLMRPLVSPRARVVATVCYLGLPLPYAALGNGRWDGLVAYAALPFIVARLARAARVEPFGQAVGPQWRTTTTGQIAALGVIIAIGSSFAPAVLPLTLVCALAIVVGSAVTGTRDLAGRVVWVTVLAVLVALVLSAPWVIGTLAAGGHAVDIFGLPISAPNAPSWGEVIRFAVGPTARSPIVWLLVAAAALPLLLGRGLRLVWAARFWALACMSWVLAYAATHGWTGSFTPSETVVLVPAAMAVAAGIGLGIASFEIDVAGGVFSWRHVLGGVAVIAVVLGVLPVAAGALDGRWGLPSNGVAQSLTFLDRPNDQAAYRVLWLGDPRALALGGWSVDAGLSYALSGETTPDSTGVWTPAGPGPADTAAIALRLALQGDTVHLGRLLAPLGVRYVVVLDGINPGTSEVASVNAPPPNGLQQALLSQNDLQVVPGQVGVQVYENAERLPVTAQRAHPPLSPSRLWSFPSAADIAGWRPVLTPLADHHVATGTVARGTVYAGYAPAGNFTLQVGGRTVARQPAFGWASQFGGATAGPATLAFHRLPFVPFFVLVELVGWVALALALLGWRRRSPAPRRRPRAARAARAARPEAPPAPEPTPAPEHA
jgi:GT2 family glycosyltransferase